MHKGDLIITNKTGRRVVKSMQVLLEERSKAYFNFINSLNSQTTKEKYKFCVEKFPESTYAHLSIYNPFYYSVGYP